MLGASAACGELDAPPAGAAGEGETALHQQPDASTGLPLPSIRDEWEAGPNDVRDGGPTDGSPGRDAWTPLPEAGPYPHPPPSDGGPWTTPGAPTLFIGICVTPLAARDPAQAIRFYTVLDRSNPNAMKVSLTALRGYDAANNVPVIPPTVSAADKRGETVTAPVTLQPGGIKFTVDVGTFTLPGEANSISGRTAVLEDVTFRGVYGGTQDTCAQLDGEMTAPYSFDLDPTRNTCLFVPVTEGAPFPSRAASAFTCTP